MTNPTGLPYTPAVRAGDWVIVSGQIGLADGELVGGGFDAELAQALANLQARLAEVGAAIADVVKTTVFLRHMTDYRAHERRCTRRCSPSPVRPARPSRSPSCRSVRWSRSRPGRTRVHALDGAMMAPCSEPLIIIVVLVVAIPVGVLMTGAVAAGLLGFFAEGHRRARPRGQRALDLNV